MSRSRAMISQFIQGEERRQFKDIVKALAFVIDLAEGYDAQHGYNVALSAVQLGKYVGLNANQLRNLFYAGLLHDVGEVGFPKENEDCDYFEWQFHPYIHQHPLIGEAIVSQLPTLKACSQFIRWHHEAWDGSGYPDKLRGDAIPIEAQIIGLCDIFDVAGSVYHDQQELKRRLGPVLKNRFAPDLISAFRRVLAETEIWNAGNFDQPTWNSLGIDSVDLALLMNLEVDYFKLTLKTFANVIDAKHQYTKGHSLRVATLSRRIAEMMGFEEEEAARIERAGFLHDAGKVGISRCILDKPGPLSDLEYNRIKAHPGMSAALLNTVQCLADHAPLVRHHHERFDGKGYPDRLKGEDIPIGSRILAVADTYDAMTSDRAYRKGLPDKVAREEIVRYRNIMYDPQVVEAFLLISAEEIRVLFESAEKASQLVY
ncbi:MAG: HD domain-containing protein [Candidatus Sericytochromatia bacterium]|nr:HD domain-containing protein [Candidatus Sericytochromatia bacterium]